MWPPKRWLQKRDIQQKKKTTSKFWVIVCPAELQNLQAADKLLGPDFTAAVNVSVNLTLGSSTRWRRATFPLQRRNKSWRACVKRNVGPLTGDVRWFDGRYWEAPGLDVHSPLQQDHQREMRCFTYCRSISALMDLQEGLAWVER